ncbi:MAG: hypothetical protein FWC73_09290 [Defluviitaleaceae bacterium]|nr:hypothetical protein [Defluviitaleaceae bacterium]
MIRNYDDFVAKLLEVGFAMGGGNSEGIYTIVPWNWNEEPPLDSPIRWHTEDKETDPWEWRIRVLEERDDIAYAKMFFKKSGFITKRWYPYFLAARRGGLDFEETYAEGTVSHFAKRIYDVISAHDRLPLHDIKTLGEFTRDEKAGFDRALTELQMKLFITMCGNQYRISKSGELNRNWPSTVLCTTEKFWGEDVFKKANDITPEQAKNELTAQILMINPSAPEKKIIKFIYGS